MKYTSTGESLKGELNLKNSDLYLIKEDLGLHLICDGYGVEGKGIIASKMTTDLMSQIISANKKIINDYKATPTLEAKNILLSLLEKAIKKVSVQIFNIVNQEIPRKQMGSNLSIAIVIENKVFLAHVGNTQVYMVREENVHLLTKDQGTKKNKAEESNIKDGDLYYGPAKYDEGPTLTKMIGFVPDVKVDLLYFEVMEGDTILLMTDGAGSMVSKSRLAKLVNDGRDSNIAKTIMATVQSRKPSDNATTVSISFLQTNAKSAGSTPQDKYATLKQIPFFTHLDYSEIAKVLSLMHSQDFIKDQNIVVEGEKGEELFVILKGDAEVIIKNNVINTLKKGDYFGEISLIDNQPRSATIKATSEMEVLVLNKLNFLNLLDKEPQVFVKMLWLFAQTLSMRMRKANLNPTETTKDKKESERTKLTPIIINFDD